MQLGRTTLSVLAGAMLCAAQLGAQTATGTITGRVIDGTTMQPLSGANILIAGTQRGTVTRADGGFLLSGVPAGTHQLRASLIGYAPQGQEVTVAADGAANVQFTLQPQAVQLAEVVATGYGTQRREAITGSVATVNADDANVGVISNPNEMIQGRVAGVQMITNNGEPGAGVQIRIRGGTSISASNEPLYVIDGVPIENRATEPRGRAVPGTSAPLTRSPLTLLNPSDIESITILKDASATAIYGSRAANGVILITTKQGRPGEIVMEYDGYVATAAAARRLDVMSGDEYRSFRVAQGGSAGEFGPENTNWEDQLYRRALTHNHNLSFSGGGEGTRYRASLNYMNQEGVVINNGFERLQGRLNAQHQTWNDRLRLGLNLTASRMENNYLPFENTGGFEGGVFTNMVIFDPTRPVRVTDAAGVEQFFEVGTGRLSVRNPVALAEQIADRGNSTRTLGNFTAALEVLPGITANATFGIDQSDGIRRTYFPKVSPVGAEWNGRGWQETIDNSAITLQTFLTMQRDFARVHAFDVVGGYEYSDYSQAGFGAESRDFTTDAFGFHNLGGGALRHETYSWRNDHRLVSFFGRGNYSFADRYFLTGVLRYDGSSRFGEGNKWALFPAISASWRISEEPFMANSFFSDLRIRAGYGLQGNPGVDPYSSLITIAPGGHYVFGEQRIGGMAPNRNPNPNLKWEETAQFNVALDYGVLANRFTGTLEFYTKETTDLLLQVPVVQPAVASTRLENVGSVRNRGVEFSLDALAVHRTDLSWIAGLVVAAERNEVVDLGGREFLTTGGVSGEGQSGQVSQRIMPGHPLGTFFGRDFVRVDSEGRQVFRCDRPDPDCVGGETITPAGDDFRVIGDANPDFTLGFRSQVDYNRFDLSFLVRGEFGRDVFNNTALVYGAKTLGGRNFLRSALDEPDAIGEPAIYSSRWIENGNFVRLQNVTLGYTFQLPAFAGQTQPARVYVSGDNLLLLTGYSGIDPEVHTDSGLASRGIDYLNYPRPRTLTTGIRFTF